MKKIILIVILFVICAVSFLPYRKASRQNQVVFWTLQMGDFAPYMNGIIKEFESMYPKIKIKWVDVPFSEGEKRTLAAILSNNPPDLVNLNPDFSNILAQKGALEKIDEEMVSQFSPEIMDSLKYKGELYALPWYATSAVTIYNKDLLQKAGLYNVPKTYEELGKVSLTIKEKTGEFAFMPTITENDTMLKILNKYGINSSKTINSQKSVEVFDFYKNLYKQNLIPKETITQTHREGLEKYMSNQIVFFQAGANFLNMIKENSPSTYKNTDVAPQIVGDLGQNDFSLMNLVIPLRAPRKKDAFKFAMFLTNEQNQLALAKLTNVLATNRRVLKDDYYTRYDEGDLIAKARVISAKQLEKIQPVMMQNKGQKEINLIVNMAVQEILLGKSSTKSILDGVAKKWNIIEEN